MVLHLPNAVHSPNIPRIAETETVTISIRLSRNEEQLWINDEWQPDGLTMRKELVELRTHYQQANFIIAADSTLTFGAIKRVMKECRLAGISHVILQTSDGSRLESEWFAYSLAR